MKGEYIRPLFHIELHHVDAPATAQNGITHRVNCEHICSDCLDKAQLSILYEVTL